MRAELINRTILAALAVAGAAALPPGEARAQVGRPAQKTTHAPAVNDAAGIFSSDAVREASRTLEEIQKSSPAHWQVIIETASSLDGKDPREAAVAVGRAANVKGLVVLISKNDRKVWVEPSGSAEAAFSKSEQTAVRDAITRNFRESQFDKGLLDAVAAIRRAGLACGVRDRANLLKPETVTKADAELDAVREKTGWSAVVETVESLDGKQPRDAALANARALNLKGLYLLIARKEHKLWAEPSNSARAVFTNERIRAIDDALTSAFKAGDFDRGVLEGVAQIRRAAESNPTAVASTKASPRADDAKPGVIHLPGPGDPAPTPRATTPPPSISDAPATTPATPPVRPTAPESSPVPTQRPTPETVPQAREGSVLPFLLIVGGGVLLFLWVVSRLFRRPPANDPRAMMPGQSAPYPQQPQPGMGVPTGYGPPQRPNPGPGAMPGYGYGPPQPPPPGYGYGGAPPAQGGGFLSGALGGLGGAVVGNILYDKFGRAISHEGQPLPHDSAGHVAPHGGAGASHPDQGDVPTQPAETYDPNAGVGGDWGTPDPNAAADEGAGGDWGNAAPEAQPADQGGVGGDWGSPDEPAPAPDGGGDWGGSPEPDTGGDWGGGGDAGSTDDNQGGGW